MRSTLPNADQALPGRPEVMPLPARHAVLGSPLAGPWPHTEQALLGMGCFWGVERLFWRHEGVVCTLAGYAGGWTPNPTYEEVCTGLTGHAEVVRVIFDPQKVRYQDLLTVFWEQHDPTQGMRQGADIGTQYRSVILAQNEAQRVLAEQTREAFAVRLQAAGFGPISTEITCSSVFYAAEDYHQQYLYKNPDGYCGVRGTGVSCAG